MVFNIETRRNQDSNFPATPPTNAVPRVSTKSDPIEPHDSINIYNPSCLPAIWIRVRDFFTSIYSFLRRLCCREPQQNADITAEKSKNSAQSTSNQLDSPQPLEQENQQLFEEINGIALREIELLPQPVDDYRIMGEIQGWTPRQMENYLSGREKAPSPLHLQAARYIRAQERSQETREEEIIPHVFVGNYDALRALDPSQGNNPRNFAQVISVTSQDPNTSNEFSRASIPENIERRVLKVNDEEEAWIELEANFEPLFQMIDKARMSGANILIHCTQGQSRSVTVMMAYLIHRLGISAEDALVFVKTRRFIAEPIPGLQQRLIAYAGKVNRE